MEWCTCQKFSPQNKRHFPIQLFLTIMEHEGAVNQLSEGQMLSHALCHLDPDSSEEKAQLEGQTSWDELKSNLIRLYDDRCQTSDKVDLLNSLAKGVEENCRHYLIRVRYVVSLMLLCQCPLSADAWTRVLFFTGLADDEKTTFGVDNPSSLESLADLIDSVRKAERDTPELAQVKTELLDVGPMTPDVKLEEEEDDRPDPAHSVAKRRGRPPKRLKEESDFEMDSSGDDENADSKNRRKKEEKAKVMVICKLCQEAVSKVHFNRHSKEKHGGMTEKCQVCSDLFPTVKKLEKHIEIHHQSDIADKVAEGLIEIDRNPEAEAERRPIGPTTVREGRGGSNQKATYSCALCTEVLTGAHAFKQHCDDAHGGKRYGCDLCSYSALSKERIYDHRLRLHFLATRGCTVYTCRPCGFKTTCHLQVSQHIQQKHSEGGREGFKCQHCGKSFRSEQAKQGHIEKVHLNLRPYPCEKCGKCFKEVIVKKLNLTTLPTQTGGLGVTPVPMGINLSCLPPITMNLSKVWGFCYIKMACILWPIFYHGAKENIS